MQVNPTLLVGLATIATSLLIAIVGGLVHLVLRLGKQEANTQALREDIEIERQGNQQLREELKQDFGQLTSSIEGLKVMLESVKGQVNELYNRTNKRYEN